MKAKVLPKTTLAYTTTLIDLVDGLGDPDKYLRRVFASMGKRASLMQVRIGIHSDTKAPDYVLDECVTAPLDASDPFDHGQPVAMAAFNGRTHKQLNDEKIEPSTSWATVGLSWDQVRSLLGQVRSGGTSAIAAAAVASAKG